MSTVLMPLSLSVRQEMYVSPVGHQRAGDTCAAARAIQLVRGALGG